ncbi:HAMP domain-containing histidine kinase [bacterium]|nr:HAMP domain-containing histidine kinase [bacterium]
MKIKSKLVMQYTILIACILFVILSLVFFVVEAFLVVDRKEHFRGEVSDFLPSIKIENYKIVLVDTTSGEWRESEHSLNKRNSIQVGIYDCNKKLIANSANFENFNNWQEFLTHEEFFNIFEHRSHKILCYSAPILVNERICGWILQVSYSQSAITWISFVKLVFGFSFLVGLVVAYFFSEMMAKNALNPIEAIILSAKKITVENLHTRIPVSKNKDELDELSQTINDLLDKTDNSVKRMKQFTADVSHEIRTPLTIIKGEIEVSLSKERNSQDYQDVLARCNEEINKLTRIINSLLDLARSDNNEEIFDKTIVDFSKLVLETGKNFSKNAEEKNIEIDFRISPNVQIVGNSDRLFEVVINLLDNALKYTKKGKIILALEKIGEEVIFTVEDTGVGIEKNEQELVFQRFYQSDKSKSSGTGLGLSIVKWIVEKHNGKISVESEVGKGSIFKVIFPAIIYE